MSKVRLVAQVAGATGVTALALGLIFPHEGRELVAYVDPIGIPTICDGVTKGVKLGDTATDEQCDAMTMAALNEAIATVRRCAPGVTFKDHQLAAWASFTYNTGPGRAGVKDGFCVLKNGRPPTLLRKLLAGDHDGACREMQKWTKAGGKVMRGLERRRAAEMKVCLGAVPS